ncbi:NAD-P-binding protein [Trametes meyenii]|nr:NAD-P-binding protein [Trametes meyenii]
MTPIAPCPTTWLVTGQLLASYDNLVVAAVRNPETATALNALKEEAKGALHILKLDVSDFSSVRASATALKPILGDAGLDYLINDAAIAIDDTADTFDPEDLLREVRTNMASPALLVQVTLPFIEKRNRKTIVNISSTGASFANVPRIGTRGTLYIMSKAALNMLTLKQKYERSDLIVITMCPGWVKTDMGGYDAMLEPQESVAGILKIVTSATIADSVSVFYQGIVRCHKVANSLESRSASHAVVQDLNTSGP